MVRKAHLALKLAVGGVVLQHIRHIIGSHKGVVQSHDLHIVPPRGGTENKASDAAESVDANLGLHIEKSPFNLCGPFPTNIPDRSS